MNRIVKHRVTAIFMLLIFGISLVGNLFSGINTRADTTDDDWKTPKTQILSDEKVDITNIPNLSNYTSLTANFTWVIPDTATVKDGEKLKFQIPDNVNINFDGVGEDAKVLLKSSDGTATIGSAVIPYGTREGTVTLNNYFTLPEHDTNRNITLSFSGSGVTNGSGPGDDSKDFIVKTGWVGAHDSSGTIPTKMQWQIVANQDKNTVSDLKISDKLGTDQTLDKDSLSVKDSDDNDIKGISVDASDTGFVISFPDNFDKDINILYTSTITTVIHTNPDESDIYTWRNHSEASYTGISEEPGGQVVPVDGSPKIIPADASKSVGRSGGGSGSNGSVVLTKTDATTKAALAGATFSLFNKSDGSILKDSNGKDMYQNIKTDNNGQIDISNLPIGDYKFVEEDAPTDYLLNKENEYEFSITSDQELPKTIDVTNQKDPSKIKGSVILTKTASDTKKALAGAIFDLQKSDGTPVATDLTTNDDGQITYDDLPGGDYQFVEKKAPAGYDLNKSKFSFTIGEDSDPVSINVVDTKKTDNNTNVPDTNKPDSTGKVVLTKFDAKTQDKLQGAKFELDNSVGDVLKDDLTTDANGQITVDNLKTGKYQFVETQAPNDYLLNNDPVSFEIKSGKVVNVSAFDNKKEDTTIPVDPSDPTNPVDPPNDPNSNDPTSSNDSNDPTDPQLPITSDPSNNQTSSGSSIFERISGISSSNDDSDKAVLPQTSSISSIFATVSGVMLLLLIVLELFTKYREV